MQRYKWHYVLTLGIALVLISSLAACTKSKETPYAPDFSLQTISGETVSLSDFHGRPVMLTFWKINCAACQFQMPFIQALYEKQSDKTIAVLTINVGDSASAALDYVTSRGLTFPVLLDRQGKASQMYGLPGVPVTFLIDAEGIAKAYKIGAFQNQAEMESAIKSVFPSLTLEPEIETGPEIGNLAPDFTLQTINGQGISLNESRGKTVLLNFWVNSCPACVDEMPYFQTVLDEQAQDELVILVINCGESSQTVKNVADDLKLTFPMLLDPDGKVCTAYKHGAPTTFLIDSNGIIRAIKDDVFENAEEIKSMLDSM
jgi:peroxiredoxin